jgi:hypothetical protein
MGPLILEVWLGVLHLIWKRALLGAVAPFRHPKGKLLLASAATGFLLSLIVGTKAANTQVYEPVVTPTPDQELAVDQVGGWFYFMNWVDRGVEIRSGHDVRQCLLNLAKALEEVKVLSASEYNGAAGALSLLPTAGALLGAPTREMWIVFKLVPIAGLLSMFLSMGATITPSDVGEYDSGKAYSYGGLMPTVRTNLNHQDHDEANSDMESFREHSEAKKFALQVSRRAEDVSGGDVFFRVWFAVFLQLAMIGVILVAMWYAQRGAVIPWWCRVSLPLCSCPFTIFLEIVVTQCVKQVWGWMYFWYFLVIVVSVFDNLVAAPFTKSWTIRVSKAPTGVIVDSTLARVTQLDDPRFETIMDRLKAGINLKHRITIRENEPSTYSRTCFYVVISIEGIDGWHAFLQTISRGCSVAVFAFGTALFASATLMSISAALMLLCLVLPMGVIGRVVAMWIAAEMNRHNQMILHTVVKTPKDASDYIKEIIDVPGLQIETMGHIILDGNCIVRRNPLTSAATYIGLLAKPYNLVAKAVKNQRQDSFGLSLIGMKSKEALSRSQTGITSMTQRTKSGSEVKGTRSGYEPATSPAPEIFQARERDQGNGSPMFGPV